MGPVSRSVIGACVVAACVGSYALGRRGHEAAPSRATGSSPSGLDAVNDRLAAVLASQASLQRDVARLDARLHETQAGQPAPVAPPSTPAAPATPAPPAVRTPDAMAAQTVVRSVLDDAVVRGRWTLGDRAKLREALAGADDDARRELAFELTTAVNSGKLSLADMQGPPF